MKTWIYNGQLITREGVHPGSLLLEDSRIAAVLGEGDPMPEADVAIDAKGLYISPGFIGLHCHGGGGYDFMDGNVETFAGAASCPVDASCHHRSSSS